MSEKTEFNLWTALAKINGSGGREYVRNLSEEELKQLNPYMVMRWLSGSNSKWQVVVLNEFVNPAIWNIPKDANGENHNNLFLDLLVVAGNGSKQNYKFNKLAKAEKSAISTKVVQRFYGYSTADARDAVKALSKKDIYDMAVSLGLQKDELKKLEQELTT